MFFLRLTLYTCAFYLVIALPIILGELAIEHWMGTFGIYFRGPAGIAAFAGFWGITWLVAFSFAFRIVFPSVWSKLAG
jgi:hypothetical protein